MNVVDTYAREVAAGRIPVGKYHRLACVRHLNDLKRVGTPGFPYHFDIKHAELFFEFAELLKHYKAEWAGQPVRLSDFQKFRLGCVFGWRNGDLRRFTTAYNELPRKTGKSFEAAIVAVYCTFFEGEPGAEGFCIATKEKQALDVVFKDITQLIQKSGLKDRLTVMKKCIYHEGSVSKLEPLGSDSDTLDGLNPHCIITDELHAFKNRGLLDVMESATGSRRNPMHYQITTAGDDPVSVGGDQHGYACDVLNGLFDDLSARTFFCCIAHADPEDDWKSEETWKKANPHYGISVKPDDMRKLAEKAIAIPSAAAEFQQKRLNLWVNASAPCLSMDGWRRGQSTWNIEELFHEICWAGLDLASKVDFATLSLVFPPTPARPRWRLIQNIWTPEGTLADRAHRDKAPYPMWVEQGWLTLCHGVRISHQAIFERILELRERFAIQRIGFDPWHVDKLRDDLLNAGLTDEELLDVPQTYQGMSSACLRMQADILAGDVDARGCPVTAWAVSNVVDQRDGKDNMMFVKKKSRGRIDPVVAATIGMALAIRENLHESTADDLVMVT